MQLSQAHKEPARISHLREGVIPIAFASDIAAVLESLGYGVWGGGTTVGGSIFLYREPPAPYVCTTIYLVGGPPDTLTYDGDTNGERPVQVRARDVDPVNLETRIEGLYKLWSAWQRYPTYYLSIRAATKPLYSYGLQDSNQGSLYIASFNIRCIQGS
jgi:hypothetical protein